jgi:ParB-like chromosome segregation protein Spo0J
VTAFAQNATTSDAVLSATESRLLAAIADEPGATQADIAKALKLSARHVRRLLAREPVRKALDAAARAGLDAGASILGRGATRAAQSLLAMATGATRATAPRVAACRAVLDGAGRLIDLVDLERRIAMIEKARISTSAWGGAQ